MTSEDIELSSKTTTPPIQGWNARDALSAMNEQYAVEIENFFPGNGSVDLRNGNARAITGLDGQGLAFGSLRYNELDFMLISTVRTGVDKVWSSTGGAVTEISGAGVTAAPQFFQQFKDRTFMKDNIGKNPVYHWTGTGNIAASGFVGPGGADILLGPMTVYKNRIYFAYRSDVSTTGGLIAGLPEMWYSDLNAITGTLTKFDFASILQLGGYIQFIGKVTRAKDFSEDELFAVITSEGEVLLYGGDYPGSTSSWGLVGRYFIPRPLGSKSFFYLGSTLVIATRQGLYPMDAIMGGNFANQTSSLFGGQLSNIINKAYVAAVNATDAFVFAAVEYYFTGINYPKGNYLLINIPISATTAKQFVMNTITGAWTLFTNQHATAWTVYKDNLYYLSIIDGVTSFNSVGMRSDYGAYDEDPYNAGVKLARTIKLRPAYNYFGDTENYKQFTFCIPTVYQSNGLSLTIDADVDYANTTATSLNTDTSKGNSYQIYQTRCGLQGIGKAASIRIDGTVTDALLSLQVIEVFWTPANPA